MNWQEQRKRSDGEGDGGGACEDGGGVEGDSAVNGFSQLHAGMYRTAPLKDLATFHSGGTPSRRNNEYWGGEYPWITAKDMKSPMISTSLDALTKEGFSKAKVAPKNSILILVRGMTLFKDVPVGLATREMAFNQDIKAIIPTKDVDPKYLLYYLVSRRDALLKYVDSAGHGTGRMNIDLLKEFPIFLPEFNEQKAIADLLATWDEAIEKTERLIQAKERRFQYLVRTLINDPHYPRCHIRDFTSECTIRNRRAQCERVLSVTNTNGFVLPEEQFKRRVASSDLSNYKLVARGQYAYNPSRINVGSIARLDDWDKGVLSPMYVVFELDQSKINSDFFLHWLSSHEARQRIRNSAQGSVRETVSFTDLGAIVFPVPDMERQSQAAEILNYARSEIDLLKNLACSGPQLNRTPLCVNERLGV